MASLGRWHRMSYPPLGPLFQLKRANLIRYLQRREKLDPDVDYRPLELSIELTNHCNYRCKMCVLEVSSYYDSYSSFLQSIGEDFRDQGFIPDGALEKSFTFFDTALTLNVNGVGESHLHARFPEILRRAKDSQLFVQYFTAGALVRNKIRDLLVDPGLASRVHFSISAARADTYKDVHSRPLLEKVLENLHGLVRLREERRSPYPQVYINFIAMQSNWSEIPALLNLLPEDGNLTLEVKPLMVYNDTMKTWLREYEPERDDPFILECNRLARKRGIQLNWAPYRGVVESNLMESPCCQPFKSIYVKWDGQVRSDCFGGAVVGSLENDLPEKIWQGEKFHHFRQSVIGLSYPQECSFCLENQLFDGYDNASDVFRLLYGVEPLDDPDPQSLVSRAYLRLTELSRELDRLGGLLRKYEATLAERDHDVCVLTQDLEKTREVLQERDRQLTDRTREWEAQGEYLETVHATLNDRDEQLRRRTQQWEEQGRYVEEVLREHHALLARVREAQAKLDRIRRFVPSFLQNLALKLYKRL